MSSGTGTRKYQVERIDDIVETLHGLLVAARFDKLVPCSRTGTHASACWRIEPDLT